MKLTPEDAPRRLLEWGLLTPAAIVDGRLELSWSARRNFNIRVDSAPGPGLFVKEPDPSLPEAVEAVAAEARFYAFCDSEGKASAVRRLLPDPRRVDGEAPLLVLELVPGGRSLWQVCSESPAGRLPAGRFAAVGEALGALHATFERPGLAADPRLGPLAEEPPVYLALHRPVPEHLRYLSGGQLEVLEMVQSEPGIVDGLEDASAAWVVESLIHGDLRWENVLVSERPSPGAGVRLIDWELVQRGDRAWDAAGVLQDFLLFWLLGMSLRPELGTAERLATARWPLASLRPAMREFWAAYRGAVGDGGRQDDLLSRAVRYAAARLAQSALEHHAGVERASPLAVLLLQVSANIFADPLRAAGDLFGLEPDGAAAGSGG